jgi:hypothetical protein
LYIIADISKNVAFAVALLTQLNDSIATVEKQVTDLISGRTPTAAIDQSKNLIVYGLTALRHTGQTPKQQEEDIKGLAKAMGFDDLTRSHVSPSITFKG